MLNAKQKIEKMIKIETHCHSQKVSPCADISLEDLTQKYKTAGYGGIVLTNHIASGAYSSYNFETHKEKINFYLSPYYQLKEICEKENIKVFLGAEVCVINKEGYSEFMIYGFEEKLLYDNKPLFLFTQEELFRLCEKYNVLMYQTHPFRNGVACGENIFMHGAESFNGHFHHQNNNDKAVDFCDKNNLIKLSGSDLHHIDQPVTGGIYIPDSINDNYALTSFIRNEKVKLITDDKSYKEAYKTYQKRKLEIQK